MRNWPFVLDEMATLQRVLAGASIARYGDGELKMADHGVGIKSQPSDPVLSKRLKDILGGDAGACMVGIPNIHSKTPKSEFWDKHARYAKMLDASRRYVSSFITRPDSAPWINTAEYWAALESLWAGLDVTLVRGSTKSLVAEDLQSARTVREIVAPRQGAWDEYASLLDRIGTPDRVLMCLGPTATVMAVDLCAKGVHAIDLGHVGMFRRKHLRGEPMWVTDQDKTAIV